MGSFEIVAKCTVTAVVAPLCCLHHHLQGHTKPPCRTAWDRGCHAWRMSNDKPSSWSLPPETSQLLETVTLMTYMQCLQSYRDKPCRQFDYETRNLFQSAYTNKYKNMTANVFGVTHSIYIPSNSKSLILLHLPHSAFIFKMLSTSWNGEGFHIYFPLKSRGFWSSLPEWVLQSGSSILQRHFCGRFIKQSSVSQQVSEPYEEKSLHVIFIFFCKRFVENIINC